VAPGLDGPVADLPRYVDYVESEMRREHGLTMPRYDVLAQTRSCRRAPRTHRPGRADLALTVGLVEIARSHGIVRPDRPRAGPLENARSWFAVLTVSGRSRVRRARQSHHALLASTFGSALNDRDVAGTGARHETAGRVIWVARHGVGCEPSRRRAPAHAAEIAAELAFT